MVKREPLMKKYVVGIWIPVQLDAAEHTVNTSLTFSFMQELITLPDIFETIYLLTVKANNEIVEFRPYVENN